MSTPTDGYRQDLARVTLDWSLGFLDNERHLVWNPSWYDAKVPTRTVHLTPNSAWVAYGLFARGGSEAVAEASRIVRSVIDLQYVAPGAVYDGTYARFAESSEPGPAAVAWQDFDHNWRQFVGTTFALILEDFPTLVPAGLVADMEESIGRACRGEPQGRIALDYTNPALMHSWMCAWYGRRCGDETIHAQGHDFAARLVARYDELGGFAEWNSPTYYGMDLYALGLWREIPPDELFASEGRRIFASLWAETLERYHPVLRNWCGPYGRSYGPDATRSVTLLGLWYWAAWGRMAAPLPPIGDSSGPEIHHSNDLMAGPVVARLASGVPSDLPATANGTVLERRLGPRRLRSWTGASLMLGAESVEGDWQGSGQAAVFTAHWAGEDGVSTLWLPGPRSLRASVSAYHAEIEQLAGGTPLCFKASGLQPRVSGDALVTDGMRVRFTGNVTGVEVRPVPGPQAPEDLDIIVHQDDGAPALVLDWQPGR